MPTNHLMVSFFGSSTLHHLSDEVKLITGVHQRHFKFHVIRAFSVFFYALAALNLATKTSFFSGCVF